MKKIIAIVLILIMALLLIGCNRQIVDLNYNFNYAVVGLPNGESAEGKVSSWRDFEDGDQLQVTIDGITYLSSSNNIVLMHK